MKGELRRAIHDARDLLSKLGRASTPAVHDRGLVLKTHAKHQIDHHSHPVVVIGDSTYFNSRGILCLEAHPNRIQSILEHPEQSQALVVNAVEMSGPWKGADSGWASWKARLIEEACESFSSSGLPVYLIMPRTVNVAFLNWATLVTAVFPDFEDTSEKTGNPQTDVWRALENWGTGK